MLLISAGDFIYCLFQLDSKADSVVHKSFTLEMILAICMMIFSFLHLYHNFSLAKSLAIESSPSAFGKFLHLISVLLFGLILICILVCFIFQKISLDNFDKNF